MVKEVLHVFQKCLTGERVFSSASFVHGNKDLASQEGQCLLSEDKLQQCGEEDSGWRCSGCVSGRDRLPGIIPTELGTSQVR